MDSKQSSLNRNRGKAWERRVAKDTGGKRVPSSGAGNIKGDVLTPLALLECKMSAQVDSTGGKQITLKREWLLKMQADAAAEGKRYGALPIHFAGCQDNYVVLPWETFCEMLREIEGRLEPGNSAREWEQKRGNERGPGKRAKAKGEPTDACDC